MQSQSLTPEERQSVWHTLRNPRLLLVELLELLLIGDVTVASAGWRGSFVDAACL